MNDPRQDLADLICEFLVIARKPGARKRLQEEAKELGGATYEQFLAMSLAQIITERFRVTPIERHEGENNGE
jgi:hypothetical protein